jgi:hypothetical protein
MRWRWTGQSRAAFEKQYLTGSFYLYHGFSVIVAQPLSFTMAWTLRATPSLRISSTGRKAQSASQPADSADNPAGKLRLPPVLLLIRSVRRDTMSRFYM